MALIDKRFYRGRVALNVLAKDIENAKGIFAAAEGYVLVGVLSKNYSSVEDAVEAMKQYGSEIEEAVSIGLGAGDNRHRITSYNVCYTKLLRIIFKSFG